MSDDPRDQRTPGLDEAGKAYRAAQFREEPPARLDAFILAAARRRDARGLGRYLPPLAAAAALLLAVGVVLRLTVPVGGPPAPLEDSAGTRPSDAGPRAQPRALMLEQAAPPGSAAREAPGAELTGTQPGAGETPRQRAPGSAPAPVCSQAPAGDPRAWLDCIRARLDAGEAAAAREALAEFRRAHPDYALPEDLARRLEE